MFSPREIFFVNNAAPNPNEVSLAIFMASSVLRAEIYLGLILGAFDNIHGISPTNVEVKLKSGSALVG